MSMAIGLAEAGADIIGVSARLDLQDSLIALEIKALPTLPGKKAKVEILINQQLASAMGLIALFRQKSEHR